MKIDTATRDDVFNVALHMRDSDYREFSALLPVQTRGAMAQLLADRFVGEDVLVAKADDTAVAIGRIVEARPNVLTLGFFATPRLREIGKPLTRFIKQRLLAPMVEAGAHRIECVSIAGHHEAHRWIRTLGLRAEAQLRGYGKGGEEFIQFSWVSDVRPPRA
jgi:hypothetical protein